MARKKVKLEWISNDAARRATFKKRRKGLIKKVAELSTLCDVRACMIVYGGGGTDEATPPEVWPSVPDAARVLAKLKRMPEAEQSKKMMDQEGFMRQRIGKLQEQLRKQDRENRELETRLLMHRSMKGEGGVAAENVGVEEVTRLAWMVEMKAGEVRKRVEGILKGEVQVHAQEEEEQQKRNLAAAMEELQRQEWFTKIMNTHHDHDPRMIFRGGGQMMGYPHPYSYPTSNNNSNSHAYTSI